MNKCPRCENENLVENQKFCQICGFKLDDLNVSKEKAIELLRELARVFEIKFTPNDPIQNGLRKYVKPLELGIEALEKDITNETSKEQSKLRILTNFQTGKFQSIELYDKQEDFEDAFDKSDKKIGLLLTPGILKANKINSIDEVFMLGFLEDEEE